MSVSNQQLTSDAGKILQLIEKLSATTDSIELQIIINNHLKTLTNASYVFLVPLLPPNNEGLIQVINDKILEKEVRFLVSSSDIHKITLKNANLNNGDCDIGELEKHFCPVVEEVVERYDNTLIYCIRNPQLVVSRSKSKNTSNTALLVCIAGTEEQRKPFELLVQETCKYSVGHLLTAVELYEEKRVRGQCQNLLRVAKHMLGKIGDLGELLKGVMQEAKNLTNAERCSLFLIDDNGELVSKVFDGNDSSEEIKIEMGKGIAGYVAQTGKLLNIRNAYNHPLFYKGVDEATGFKTKNLLCFPICGGEEEGVIGVAQLCNKLDGYHFDKCDEETATAFSVYCGISIMHALVHRQVQKAEARYKLSQELLLYHMKVPDVDIQSLLSDTTPLPDFSSFNFCPRSVNDHTSIRISLKMFENLNFCKKFHIRRNKLARFILTVQKGYRDTPYHNWDHAFSVAHFAYCLLYNLKLTERGFLSPLQGLSFLIAGFCHDLDHRGMSNSYMAQTGSPLARLYSSEGSVNERHHLSQAICILNDSSSKILDGLTTEEFKECIDYLRNLILDTDLANHFRKLNDIKTLTSENITTEENRALLMSLLITSCDLNDQVKTWETVHTVAELVYAEFFAQGDLEKQMGLRPDIMNDRQKACIPRLQIEFLDSVIFPTFQILAQIFPETSAFLSQITLNRNQWAQLVTKEHKEHNRLEDY
ncbi:cGMP-dependent 3',5'-cyclic phosphodiesterase-like [Culicoides brevitarsis]|uniref:cGMP-dependent 3',5'-cyclic phosphodiesterase-like n=1 Tax=Culicoides brevitarsis TaxID=469753 RepID=UPI00307C40E9